MRVINKEGKAMLLPRNPRSKMPREQKKPVSRHTKRQLIWILILTVVMLFVYFGAQAIPPLALPVMIVYMVALAAFLIAYVIYNRAFSYKNVTEDMLPADWSAEKKRTFMEENRARVEKSRWMLTVIVPLVLVFMADALYLFVWDGWLGNMMKSLYS